MAFAELQSLGVCYEPYSRHAPHLIGTRLSTADIVDLAAACPRLVALKTEADPLALAELVQRLDGRLGILNGRGALVMIDCLRAGADGFIVAPDALPGATICWAPWRSGRLEQAEGAYRAALPGWLFSMQSIDHLVCYGKRIFGLRTGLPIHDRAPALSPVPFGLSCAARYAR